MPRIKELSNTELEDYLDAYNAMLAVQPRNKDFLRKASCIEEALRRRDLINYDLDDGNKKSKGFLSKIFGIFKRNK